MKAYTGVGSHSTPKVIFEMMVEAGYKLAGSGYTLRSGAAEGADTAFEIGVVRWFQENGESYPAPVSLAQIYTPWASFADIYEDYKDWYKVLDRLPNKDKAQEMTSEIHPAWDKCSRGAKALHSRNVYQVLGTNLNSPSNFLICWAEVDKQGKPKGGTRTSWMLGEQCIGIDKCFNLYFDEHRKRVENWLK